MLIIESRWSGPNVNKQLTYYVKVPLYGKINNKSVRSRIDRSIMCSWPYSTETDDFFSRHFDALKWWSKGVLRWEFSSRLMFSTSDRPNFGIVGNPPNRIFSHSLSETSEKVRPNRTRPILEVFTTYIPTKLTMLILY